MKTIAMVIVMVMVMASAAIAQDFANFETEDVVLANQIVTAGSCTAAQKSAMDDVMDAADLAAFASGQKVPSNAAEAAVVKAATLCN